ncbi:hypothetical protein Agub_g10363, partial [Astrephomene gubernaculifera]
LAPATNRLAQLFRCDPGKLEEVTQAVAEGLEWRGLVRMPAKLQWQDPAAPPPGPPLSDAALPAGPPGLTTQEVDEAAEGAAAAPGPVPPAPPPPPGRGSGGAAARSAMSASAGTCTGRVEEAGGAQQPEGGEGEGRQAGPSGCTRCPVSPPLPALPRRTSSDLLRELRGGGAGSRGGSTAQAVMAGGRMEGESSGSEAPTTGQQQQQRPVSPSHEPPLQPSTEQEREAAPLQPSQQPTPRQASGPPSPEHQRQQDSLSWSEEGVEGGSAAPARQLLPPASSAMGQSRLAPRAEGAAPLQGGAGDQPSACRTAACTAGVEVVAVGVAEQAAVQTAVQAAAVITQPANVAEAALHRRDLRPPSQPLDVPPAVAASHPLQGCLLPSVFGAAPAAPPPAGSLGSSLPGGAHPHLLRLPSSSDPSLSRGAMDVASLAAWSHATHLSTQHSRPGSGVSHASAGLYGTAQSSAAAVPHPEPHSHPEPHPHPELHPHPAGGLAAHHVATGVGTRLEVVHDGEGAEGGEGEVKEFMEAGTSPRQVVLLGMNCSSGAGGEVVGGRSGATVCLESGEETLTAVGFIPGPMEDGSLMLNTDNNFSIEFLARSACGVLGAGRGSSTLGRAPGGGGVVHALSYIDEEGAGGSRGAEELSFLLAKAPEPRQQPLLRPHHSLPPPLPAHPQQQGGDGQAVPIISPTLLQQNACFPLSVPVLARQNKVRARVGAGRGGRHDFRATRMQHAGEDGDVVRPPHAVHPGRGPYRQA